RLGKAPLQRQRGTQHLVADGGLGLVHHEAAGDPHRGVGITPAESFDGLANRSGGRGVLRDGRGRTWGGGGPGRQSRRPSGGGAGEDCQGESETSHAISLPFWGHGRRLARAPKGAGGYGKVAM